MTWRAGVHSVIGLALLRPSAPAPEGVDYRNWLGRKARRCQRRPVRISLSVLWTLPSDTPTLPPRPRTQLLIGQIPRQPVRVADQGIPNLQISVDVLNCAPR
jgi:hypothetical protein